MSQEMPPIKVAFILDGKVIDVLHTDERLGALFLSEPVIIDVTQWYEEHQGENLVNYDFDGTNFHLPEGV